MRTKFICEEVYHVYNRGVDKRRIFQDVRDHTRFIHDLFEFNDEFPAQNIAYRFQAPSNAKKERRSRKLLVEILCFALMPNHYHLLLRQKNNGGITEFMRKLGAGYTNYFNQRYQRSGVLFQGKFKAKSITNESYFSHIPHYIHANPLELVGFKWGKKTVKQNNQKLLSFLESYRWSSYADFIGKRNYPSVIQPEFLLPIYGSPTSYNYKDDFEKWLKGMPSDILEL